MSDFKPRRIIIHHSATRDTGTVSWAAIRYFHTMVNGWSDIGYHAGIEAVSFRYDHVYECFVGRPETKPGAHTKGQNHDSLGFCFVGNFDEEEPEHEMLAVAARRVLAPWCIEYGLDPLRGADEGPRVMAASARLSATEVMTRNPTIQPHSMWAPKTCPGELFPMDRLRELVAEAMEEM